MLNWGGQLETLLEIQEKTGVTPVALRSKPDLLLRGIKFWNGFWYLSDQRQTDFGSRLPITASEIKSYLWLVDDLEKEYRVVFMRMTKAMDDVFIEFWKAKEKAQAEADKNKK